MPDKILELVRHIRRTEFDDLPPGTIDSVKLSVLDLIGCAIAGSSVKGCADLVSLIKDWGGKQESSIWIYGGKVPANLASYALGFMTRALDFGDVHEATELHTTEFLTPAAFPIAERQGNVSGKDLITAIALGRDVMIRVHRGMRLPEDGYDRRTIYNITAMFGIAATVIKLLRLDENQAWNAMGLTYAQIQGSVLQHAVDGSMGWVIRHGFSADAVIKAALMAQRGLTGAKNILEGRYGFYRLFAPDHDLEPVTADIGKFFEGSDATVKSYPCCLFASGIVSEVIDLVRQHDIRPEDIDSIDVGVIGKAMETIGSPSHYEPRSVSQLPHSLPYIVATTLVTQGFFIEDLTEEAMHRREVRELMPRVKMRLDPQIVSRDSISGGSITLLLKNGQTHYKVVPYAKGHPKNPLSLEDVELKFRKCAAYAAKPLADSNIDEVVKTAKHLETVFDVSVISRLLST